MSSSRVAPSVFAHSSRAEWGHGVIAEELSDRTKYVFENAGVRTFMNGPSSIHEVELPAAEREALAKQLLRRHALTATRKKKAPAKKKAEPAMSFDNQHALFATRFEGGFSGATYTQEERCASEGHERNLDSLIALARELFAQERLDDAIGRGAFEEVHADGLALIVAAQRLAFPKTDKPVFEKMPKSAYEGFAKALRALLHGDGAYPVRFNAFVKSIGPKGVPWTIATIFSAAMHPEAHVLVKPSASQRQAKALGIKEPPIGAPSGATYTKHLAVANALQERLVTAGHEPRDLFDVYTFQWRTLAKGAAAPASAD
jgi:hypothetical protein